MRLASSRERHSDMNSATGRRGERCLGFAQSGSSSAKGRFANVWKKSFQWLEKFGRFSNDWKNFSEIFQ